MSIQYSFPFIWGSFPLNHDYGIKGTLPETNKEVSLTLPETYSLPLKMGAPWKRRYPYWKPPFLGANC